MALIQQVGTTGTSSPTALTVTSTVNKNYLVCCVSMTGTGTPLPATPSGWTKSAQKSTSTLSVTIFTYAGNPGAITSVSIATASGTLTSFAIDFSEYDHFLTSATVDSTATASGTSTSPSVTPGATTTANELWIAALGYISSTNDSQSAFGSWHQDIQEDNNISSGAHLTQFSQTVTSTGTPSFSCTLAQSKTWTVVVATISGVIVSPRTIPQTAALLATNTRTVPQTVALLATDTRTVPQTAALKAILTRTVTQKAALLAKNTRTIPQAIAFPFVGRVVPQQLALLQTTYRIIGMEAALLATNTHTIPQAARLLATDTRTVPQHVALIAAANVNRDEDTFQRTSTTQGWGSSSNNDVVTPAVWTGDMASGSGNANVALWNNCGLVLSTLGANNVFGLLNPEQRQTGNNVCSFYVGNAHNNLVFLVQNVLTTSEYMLKINLNTGTNNITLQKKSGGVTNTVGTSASLSMTQDTWYLARFDVSNSSGNAVLQGKVWTDGTAEPAYMVSYTDTGILAAGNSGLGAGLIGAQTGGSIVFNYYAFAQGSAAAFATNSGLQNTLPDTALAPADTASTTAVPPGDSGAGDQSTASETPLNIFMGAPFSGTLDSDTFSGRTTTNTWGTASDGSVWTGGGNNTNLSVSGGLGYILQGGTTVPFLGTRATRDLDLTVQITLASASDIAGVAFRATSTATYQRIGISGTQIIYARRLASSFVTTTVMGSVAVDPGVAYWLHVRVLGGNFYANVWPVGENEPTDFAYSAADSSNNSSGFYGLFANPAVATTQDAFANFTVVNIPIVDEPVVAEETYTTTMTQAFVDPTLPVSDSQYNAVDVLDYNTVESQAMQIVRAVIENERVQGFDALQNKDTGINSGTGLPYGGLWVNWNYQGSQPTQTNYSTGSDINTTCNNIIPSPGTYTVAPRDMDNIDTVTQLKIDQSSSAEFVIPTAVTPTTFTAVFAKSHTVAPWNIQGPTYTGFFYTSFPDTAIENPGAPAQQYPSHDPLTDLRFLQALARYQVIFPADTTYTAELAKWIAIVKQENGSNDSRGWGYFTMYEIYQNTGDSFFLTNAAGRASYFSNTEYVGVNTQGFTINTIYAVDAQNYPQGRFTVADTFEAGCALIHYGTLFNNSTYVTQGYNVINFIWQYSMVYVGGSPTYTFPDTVQNIVNVNGSINTQETFVPSTNQLGYTGNVTAPGSNALMAYCLLKAYEVTADATLLTKAQQILDQLDYTRATYSSWDTTHLGYFRGLQWQASGPQVAGQSYTVLTGKKESSRQLQTISAFHLANRYLNNRYATVEATMLNVALTYSYIANQHGGVYETDSAWNPINSFTCTSEANGLILINLLQLDGSNLANLETASYTPAMQPVDPALPLSESNAQDGTLLSDTAPPLGDASAQTGMLLDNALASTEVVATAGGSQPDSAAPPTDAVAATMQAGDLALTLVETLQTSGVVAADAVVTFLESVAATMSTQDALVALAEILQDAGAITTDSSDALTVSEVLQGMDVVLTSDPLTVADFYAIIAQVALADGQFTLAELWSLLAAMTDTPLAPTEQFALNTGTQSDGTLTTLETGALSPQVSDLALTLLETLQTTGTISLDSLLTCVETIASTMSTQDIAALLGDFSAVQSSLTSSDTTPLGDALPATGGNTLDMALTPAEVAVLATQLQVQDGQVTLGDLLAFFAGATGLDVTTVSELLGVEGAQEFDTPLTPTEAETFVGMLVVGMIFTSRTGSIQVENAHPQG